MGFVSIIFKLVILLVVANVVVLSPSLDELVNFLWHSVVPGAIETAQGIYFKVQEYCPEQVMQDFSRTAKFAAKTFHHVFSAIVLAQPTVCVALDLVASAVNSLHEKGIAYTDDFLRRLLGVEVIVLADQVGESKSKFLSVVLFALWFLVGLVSVSRMSFRRFLAVMSGMFLLHSYYGPVWCMRRLAFLFGLCLWLGSIATNRPILVVVTVLVAFSVNGMRARRKKVHLPNEEDNNLQDCNNNEVRIERLERKMDLLLTKIECVMTKLDMIERVVNE